MKQRIITAVILLAIVACGFIFEPLKLVLVFFLLFLALACVWELDRMYRPRGVEMSLRVALIGVTALVFAGYRGLTEYSAAIIGAVLVLAFFARMIREHSDGAWHDISATVGAVLYIGLPLGLLTEIFISGQTGRMWLLFMLTIVWFTDTMALFVGKSIGRHKIFPVLSPKKTWEGSIGGLIGAMIPVFAWRYGVPDVFSGVGLIELIVLGALLSVFTQFGDLAESMLKRDAGVKDSGNLLAGHGGALDRLDSILMAALPFAGYLHLVRPDVVLVSG